MSKQIKSTNEGGGIVIKDIPAAALREPKDNAEGNGRLPMWFVVLLAIVAASAGVQFGLYHGGFKGDVFNESESSPALFSNNINSAVLNVQASEVSLFELGKSIYSNCVPCHQASGGGLPGQFPSLVGADWVVGSEKRLIAILLKGIQGPLKVGEVTYNGAMPPWEKILSEKKIAAVATFVRGSWGNAGSEISEQKVAAVKKEFSSQSAPWTQEELLKIPADSLIEAEESVKAHSQPIEQGKSENGTVSKGSQDLASLERGKQIYMTVCVACHQPSGLGLPPVFPTLAKTEYVEGSDERLSAIILKGIAGPINVNGSLYVNVMPPQEQMLSDDKIAAVASFVRSSFGNSSAAVSAETVARVRKRFSERKEPWTEAELKAFGDESLKQAK